MDGLTDYPFRKMIAKYGKPDLIYTEFVCVDHIFHGKQEVIEEFIYDDEQCPIVAQIFGIDPELFYISAQVICELGFDGVDINMGCPAKTVTQRGGGSGLINNHKLAAKIISATKRGVKDWVENGLSKDLPPRVLKKVITTKETLKKYGVKFSDIRKSIPVSVKTRIGYLVNELDDWLPFLLEQDLECIAVHGRTFKQMYHGEADWEALKHAGELVHIYNEAHPQNIPTLILGNGDIQSREQAEQKSSDVGLDGVLIGRGFLGKPWLLSTELANQDIFAIILEHSKIQDEFTFKKFFTVRKHLAWYCKGFRGASDLRSQLVLSNSHEEVKNILQNFLTKETVINNL